jgi:hypothetical protein
MPDDSPPSPHATRRREFLRLLALAPVAAAGCATTGGARSPASAQGAGPSAPGPGAPAEAAATEPDPLAPVRDFPLPMGSEPAFVFRAVLARPGERP